MSEPTDTNDISSPDQVRGWFLERARAELRAADALAPGSDVVASDGPVFAAVMAVKGLAGPAEACGQAALCGADGLALRKALEALGWGEVSVFATLSRPDGELPEPGNRERLRLQIEAVDPILILALDEVAGVDVCEALGIKPLGAGKIALAHGRRVLVLEGLEESLSDAARKKRVWAQLKAAQPSGPIY